jgi:hypothetical protein
MNPLLMVILMNIFSHCVQLDIEPIQELFQFIGVRTTLGTSELVDSQIARAFPFYGNSSIPSPSNYYAKSGVSLRLIKEDGELIDSIVDVEGNRYPVTKNWKSGLDSSKLEKY